MRITADQARRLVLHLQGLADPPRRCLRAAGVLDLIERLGFLQLDSISTVARAHHMILFARNQTYRPA
ncbi:MAG: winged helix-turn-helix domain-containing protein, partial [Geminicoccaceae bacterium]